MKVLLVSSMFPPYCGGGVTAHVRDLAQSLAKAGHETYVLTSRRSKPIDPNEQKHAPPSTRVIFCKDFPHMFTSYGKFMRSNDFDIVHFHSFNSLGLAFLGSGTGASVFTMHCGSAHFHASLRGWNSGYHPIYRLALLFERIAIKIPDLIITASKYNYEYAQSLGARKIAYIPNAVDCEYWTTSNEKIPAHAPSILLPKSLIPTGGVEYGIRAMEMVIKEVPDATMLVAGDGFLRNSLEELAKKVADNSVRFLGEVPRESMRELYSAADIILLPSITFSSGIRESTSIAALEAMACGRPVVASGIGGLSEIIRTGENGILVPEREPTAIANALVTLLRDKALASRIGLEAKERVTSNFSATVWVRQVLSAYEEALSQCKMR